MRSADRRSRGASSRAVWGGGGLMGGALLVLWLCTYRRQPTAAPWTYPPLAVRIPYLQRPKNPKPQTPSVMGGGGRLSA